MLYMRMQPFAQRLPVILVFAFLVFGAFTLTACGSSGSSSPPPQEDDGGDGGADEDGGDSGGDDGGGDGGDGGGDAGSMAWRMYDVTSAADDGLGDPDVTGTRVVYEDDTLTFEASTPSGWTVVIRRPGGFVNGETYQSLPAVPSVGDLSVTITGPGGSCAITPAMTDPPPTFDANVTVGEPDGTTPRLSGTLAKAPDTPNCEFLSADPFDPSPLPIAFTNILP